MKNENNNEKDPEFIRDLFRYRHRRCLETGYYNPHPESFSEQPALLLLYCRCRILSENRCFLKCLFREAAFWLPFAPG